MEREVRIMIESYLKQIESNLSIIHDKRKEIADLKELKITERADAWKNAEGTAKEKEDYVKSVVADYEKEISYREAEIEYLYNKNALLNDRMVFINDD